MTSDDGDFQKRLTAALSMPDSAQRFLYVYWLAATEWVKRSIENEKSTTPQLPPRGDNGLLEWAHRAQDYIAKNKMFMERIRRIEGYFGHPPQKIDPKILDGAKSLCSVRWIRAAIQDGRPDEEIASWLSNYLNSSTSAQHGRPPGTVDYEGHAVLALVLHDWNPKVWSYPKLADKLLECNGHAVHDANSGCVDKLKKAVARLRAFLQELGYEPKGK